VVEAFSEVEFPDRGMLGQHALFDPAVIRVPSPDEPSTLVADARGEYELRILRLGEVTRVFYPFNPHRRRGLEGDARGDEAQRARHPPRLSDRYHLPPSAHSTFIMRNAVICTFLPRPLENGDPPR
jgi:homogentisate 1,2-dioxygenase